MSQNGNYPTLDETFSRLLARRRTLNQLRQLTTVPPGTGDFSSNAYLSLSSQPAVQRAFITRLSQAQHHGAGGSRLLDGNSTQAEALERRIAAFHRAPAGLLFNSAMDANVGLFGCAPQPGDAIIYDELIHASVHDGMRLSRVVPNRRIAFAHNQPQQNPLPYLTGKHNIFIAIEGIYSMDGDVAPLASIISCVNHHLPSRNSYIIVDEAHSIGVLGDRGRGLVCSLKLEAHVWARVLGFGKAMGCAGGMVLCSSPTTRLYLVNYARSLIYTTAMALPSLVSIDVAYDFLMTGQAEGLRAHLRRLVRHAHQLLLAVCARQRPPPALFRLNAEEPKSPIIPVCTSRPRSLALYCQQRRFMVRPIVAPTVAKGSERIRVCLHAANTVDEVEILVKVMEQWVVDECKKGVDRVEEQETASTSVLPSNVLDAEKKAKL
ncbi:pyridoxal phosphate-dependent transferase [Bombardia bombarda]|uniref:Pyridoxal phosphate-dependent transferase n=1 Tax=Bombardia bombarda TaxID=252184 RepID=A0AA40C9V8_9PEZI|nr:pyridoxal phosphate-dependent transferase [Bombardia bombarda]